MQIISAQKAFDLLQENSPASRWATPYSDGVKRGYDECKPGMGGSRIFNGVLQLRVKPKFTLSRDSAFFAAGSCFARNVEMALKSLGHRVNSRPDGNPIDPSQLHRYNTHSILNDFHFAADGYDERLALNVDGKWTDLTFYGRFDSRDNFFANRNRVIDLHKVSFGSDVIILTLGLVEAWYDLVVKKYLNIAPRPDLISSYPDRFELRILNYSENLAALQNFYQFFKKRTTAKPRFIVTVSPVAFNATFSGDDVIIANTYSKSTLRAAAEDFANEHDDVDYFPSFEIANYSSLPETWLPDYRHVKPSLVQAIMKTFIAHYLAPH